MKWRKIAEKEIENGTLACSRGGGLRNNNILEVIGSLSIGWMWEKDKRNRRSTHE